MISVEEYLKTTADPDCEYVDGAIALRTPAELDHSSWQVALLGWFSQQVVDWKMRVLPSLRLRVSPTRFRVPDVTLLSRAAPREQIVTHAPLAVFEILSPEDSMARMLEKLADYEAMGITAIWVIEPKKRLYYSYREGRLAPGSVFELPGSTFSVPFAEIAALTN